MASVQKKKLDVRLGQENYMAIDVPGECTVGRWKQLLGEGVLGDKILYATKLVCRGEEKGVQLDSSEPLPEPPNKLYMDGPGSVVKMLELALRKKLGGSMSRPVTAAPAGGSDAASARPVTASAAPGVASGQRFARSPAFPSAPKHGAVLRSSCSNEGLECVCAGLQGMRPHMEDRTLGLLELPGYERAALFAVFDGHGGHEVSDMAKELLPKILAGCLNDEPDADLALKKSFRKLDEEIFKSAEVKPHPLDRTGSTAVVCLVLHEAGGVRRLLCANAGDSRAVLCRQGHAMDMSVDQKPQHPEERRRIEAAGGKVQLFGPCWRIDGGLNLSRSLGDFAYKANEKMPFDQQKVIVEPEVKEVIIGKDDRFVVMGSDGVFDVLSSETLALHLLDAKKEGTSWSECVDSALNRALPSGDNVSLCLVEFLHP